MAYPSPTPRRTIGLAATALLIGACNNSPDDPGTDFSSTTTATTITASDTNGTNGTSGDTDSGSATGSTSGSTSGATDSGSASTGSSTSTGSTSGSTGAVEPVCGNGMLEMDEECDDGNTVDADGCEADCTKAACDNGIIDPQEICQMLAGSYDAGTNPSHLAVGDLNDDQIEDVVTVAPNDNEMSRFLMGSDGVPTSNQAFVAGLGPIRITLGDVDDDQDLDVMILDEGSNEIITKLNDSNGDFGANTVVAGGTDVVSLVAGQVNLDGTVDMVMADKISIINPPDPIWSGPALRIYDGDGAGAFTETGIQQTDGVISDITLANMDNDGLTDFVVVTGQPSLIRVYAGSNVGNVDPAGSSLLPGVPTSFALGHADDDMILDAVVSVEGDDDLYLLGGDGNAEFLFSSKLPLNAVGTAVTFVDLDDDGKQDLAAATEDGELHLLRRVGQLQFITEAVEMLSGAPSDIGVSDFNGDGLSDLVVTVPSAGKLDVVLSSP